MGPLDKRMMSITRNAFHAMHFTTILLLGASTKIIIIMGDSQKNMQIPNPECKESLGRPSGTNSLRRHPFIFTSLNYPIHELNHLLTF